MKYAKAIDANHGEILQYLRKHGVHVQDCSNAGILPDALVSYRGANRWMEIKVATRADRRYTKGQLKTIAETPMDVAFITNAEDALMYAQTGEGKLSQVAKDAITLLLLKEPRKVYTAAQVERCTNK